jgi:cytochrome oxidase Cu insertion factor (SCO1/SenC/PrrC family)
MPVQRQSSKVQHCISVLNFSSRSAFLIRARLVLIFPIADMLKIFSAPTTLENLIRVYVICPSIPAMRVGSWRYFSKAHTTDMKPKLLIVLAICCLLAPLWAQDSVTNAPVTHLQLMVPDLTVVNQSGEKVRFNSDVINNRVAVVTSFFTSCTAFCPLTQERLSRLAKELGDRMGKDVVFVSVSVDPKRDNPQQMKAWGEKFHIGRGWTLVSGQKEDIATLLKSFGLYVDMQRHQSALIIGNQKQGWVRVSSWASPAKLAQVIDGVAKGTAVTAQK